MGNKFAIQNVFINSVVIFFYFSCNNRPPWDRSMSPDELAGAERDSFLEWRRSLAELQEKEGIIMTPFEKNLEFWRQLWRVIERRLLINYFIFNVFFYLKKKIV